MKIITIRVISILSILIGLLLIWNIGVKFFFNDYLFETPNLKGLTTNEATTLVGENFRLVNMGEHYSKLKAGEIYSQLPVSPKHIKKSRPIKIWISKGLDAVVIPDLSGKTLQEARAILSKDGIKVSGISHTMDGTINNLVLGTDPKTGTTISRDNPISLLVNVSEIQNIRMPDILGYSENQGIRVLRSQNLVIGDIKIEYRDDFPKGTIIDSNHASGEQILAGSVINITVTTDKEEE